MRMLTRDNFARVVESCSLSEGDIVKFFRQADRMRPAYCIALRPDKKQVLLIVRGTKSIGDAITILTGSLLPQLLSLPTQAHVSLRQGAQM